MCPISTDLVCTTYLIYHNTKIGMIMIYIFLLYFSSSLNTSTMKRLEPEFYEEMVQNTKGNVPERVYFNKGL